MKRTILLFSFLFLIFFCSSISAQGFLKKIAKSIEQASKEVDKIVNDADNAVSKTMGAPSDIKSVMPGYEAATIRSFSSSVDFILESCINDGKTLTLTYYLQNRGKELNIRGWGDGANILVPDHDTKVFDDLGNEYKILYNSVGKEYNTSGVWFMLHEGLKVKCEIKIAKFDKRAKSLQLMNIAGALYDQSKPVGREQYLGFTVVLKNVPVYTAEQILATPKTLVKKVSPKVDSQTKNTNCVVKSVIITEKNTQITFTWTNLSNSYIYMGKPDVTCISVNNYNANRETVTARYPLIGYYGIAQDRNVAYSAYSVPNGSLMDFTLVFEKIPDETDNIDIIFDDWQWNSVWLKEKEKTVSDIPTTSGTIGMQDKLFVLTKEGVGCLKKNMLVSKIPSNCSGLYDRFEKNLVEDDFNGNYTEYIFYSGTEKVVSCKDLGDGKFYYFDAYSPKISTPEGAYPGMPVKEFLKIKGSEIASYNDGVYLKLNGFEGYTINYDREDLTASGEKAFNEAYNKGTDVKFSNSYFKEAARVISISNY